jgi:hypothetical protein
MAEPFSWTCPYCDRDTTITDTHTSFDSHSFAHYNKDGSLAIATRAIVCPNPECKEYEIRAYLYTRFMENGRWALDKCLMEWKLKPKSGARVFSSYIPKPILADYEEACLIANDSPKASATLSRRCLQGMIRDFWGISKPRLVDEITALQGKIDSTTWDAIDAVRGVGNIGAHMEKDINTIVDVEPDEAQMLIGLIEFLLRDWYVGRHEREEHKKRVIALGAAKTAAKKGTPSSP